MCIFILGYFVEDDGEYYVCLIDEYNLNELDNEVECLVDVGYRVFCSGVFSFENGENFVNGIEVCVDKQNFGDDN